MKVKRKFPDQKIKTPKHKGRVPAPQSNTKRARLDPFLEQELFSLWSAGHSLMEIYEMYLGTPRTFCYQTLRNIKQKNKWEERVNKILLDIKANQENQIKISQRRQMNTLQMILDMNSDRVRRDYMDYLNDPVGYIKKYTDDDLSPPWMAQDISDFAKLSKTYGDIAKPAKLSNMGDGSNDLDIRDGIQFSQEQESQIFKILRDAAAIVSSKTNSSPPQIDIPSSPIKEMDNDED